MKITLINKLKLNGIEYIISPYESDAQVFFLFLDDIFM